MTTWVGIGTTDPGDNVRFGDNMVGIGVTTPEYPLDVVGRSFIRGHNGGGGGFWSSDSDAPGTGVSYIGRGDDSENHVGFYSNGDWRLVIPDSTGYVGIGSVSPSCALDVVGTVKASTAVITPAVKPASDGTTALQLQKSDGTSILNVDTSNSRVGIGSTLPSYELDVAGTIQANHAKIANIQPLSDSTMAFLITDTNMNPVLDVDTSNYRVGIGSNSPTCKLDVVGTVKASTSVITNAIKPVSDGTSAIELQNDSGSPILTVDTLNSRVGIGSNTPSCCLDVNGKIYCSSDIETFSSVITSVIKCFADNYGIQLRNSSGNVILHADMLSKTIGIGTTNPGATLDVRGSAIFNEAGGDYDFRVEGDTDANLLVIDASADKIGIGTVSPANKLSVAGAVSIGSNYAGNSAPSDGIIVEGKVGIGKTSPDEKLEVNGNIKFSDQDVKISAGTTVPTSGSGVPGNYGDLYVYVNDSYSNLYIKVGSGDTGWAACRN